MSSECELPDVLRQIWSGNLYCNEQIPASDDPHVNQFFEDGIAHIEHPSDLPPRFVVIEDPGDVLRTRAAGRLEERKPSVLIRIATGNKALTRHLTREYLSAIERSLRGAELEQGFVDDYVIESRQSAQVAGGLRLSRVQLTATVRVRRPWQMPDARVAFPTQQSN